MNNKEAILITLKGIPSGKVITYGNLAKRAGIANGGRQVGTFLSKLPKDTLLPWHRVVNAKREISFKPTSPQHELQKNKLEEENIEIVKQKIPHKYFI